MKTTLLISCLIAGAMSVQAVTIAQWTFESPNTPAEVQDVATYPNLVPPTVGSGNASGVHLSGGTDWTTPVGNGSAESWSANNWSVGDYWQFQVSTVGYQNIALSWDQASSSTGPGVFGLYWSTEGTFFTKYGDNYNVLANASPNPTWNSTTFNNVYQFTVDLSSIVDLNDAAAVYFILRNESATTPSGGAIGASGTSRIDNFTVSGTSISSVPDAGATGLLLAFPLLGLWAIRRVALKSQV